ncbi:carbohydrate ABC transporter permease [Actinopolymorpha pittospori]|uniref:Multiple sugar transport system permease protein n=1 Tax=Actinopolymorpha pittospori TaxID=648752 RepID=A0A927RK32_9ACTN|nr:carbohydrate ABC transporter permease [Actinopolymorpha pittospori]MBE1606303.1 multiple sugar transport system permease protein [Actinopolymorpha pittospori]
MSAVTSYSGTSGTDPAGGSDRVRGPVPAGRPRARRIPWRRILIYTLAVLFALYIIVPFYWIIATSFMHEVDALSTPPQWIPLRPTLDNYRAFVDPQGAQALVGSRAAEAIAPALFNSAVVATSTALLNLGLGISAAYAFARMKFRGSQALLLFYLATRMVPGVAIIVPFYLVMRRLDLLDTYGALVLSYTTFSLPFTIWILKDYFCTIPGDIEDAARVDGCGWWRMMWSVFLPIATPGLVAASIFSFMTAWNEFLFALFLTSTTYSQTVPVIAANFATDLNVSYTSMAAAGVVAVIPPLILVLVFQRLIVNGLASGAVR